MTKNLEDTRSQAGPEGTRNNQTAQTHLNTGSNIVEQERWLSLQKHLPCRPDKLSLIPGVHAKRENKKLQIVL